MIDIGHADGFSLPVGKVDVILDDAECVDPYVANAESTTDADDVSV